MIAWTFRQFTSAEFTSVLINNGISISMDGKGAWRDNVFVERFWRTIKYEESICTPMKASAKHGKRSAATSPSTTQGDLTSLLTAAPRIKPTLIRCRSARQLNPRADDPLSDAEILFRGPGPPHYLSC